MFAFVVAFAVAYVATPVLARRAGSAWRDGSTGSERARKPQARAVPTVGGAALVLAVVVAHAAVRATGDDAVLAFDPRVPAVAAVASLFLAAAVGAWDDARTGGLGPVAKLVAQALCTAPVALAVALEHGVPAGAVLAAAGVVAMNLANTWDHHDGSLASLASVGFLAAGGVGARAWAGGLLGFLPRNLDAPVHEGEGATPTAYLGDAGSHLVGLAAVLVPGAAWLLLLPALDLARVVVDRIRAGERWWVGDRRHLSHRLARRLGSRRAVAATTTAVALPALVGGAATGRAGWSYAGWLGAALTTLLYAGALVWSARRAA